MYIKMSKIMLVKVDNVASFVNELHAREKESEVEGYSCIAQHGGETFVVVCLQSRTLFMKVFSDYEIIDFEDLAADDMDKFAILDYEPPPGDHLWIGKRTKRFKCEIL